MEDFFTVEQVCKHLQIGRHVLYQEIKEGHLVGIRVGKGYRFSKEAIAKWLKAKEIKPDDFVQQAEESEEQL